MIPFWKKTDKGGKKTPPKPAIPHTAQQSIPMQRMFEDGTCRVRANYYTRTIAYQDINYQLAQQEDKNAIFEEWCSFLNFFDSSIKFELSFVNMATDSSEFEKSIRIPFQKDGFDDVRAEYSLMLRQQLAKGNNGLTKTKFITFGVEGESMRQVKTRLDHVQNDLLNNFHRLGVQAKPLNGTERLKLMHDMFHMDGESKFRFEWNDLVKSGLSVKDAIAPTAFAFKNSRTFQMGGIYCAASFLSITASDISDQLLKDFLDMDSSQIVTMHIQSVDQNRAIKTVKRTITELDRSKIEEQKKAIRAGYDIDIIPSDLATYGRDAKALLKELQSQNERMFLVTFLVLNAGRTEQELENNVFQASSIAQKHNCNLCRLDYQQEQGLSFAYQTTQPGPDGKPAVVKDEVLHDISFTAKAGQKTALVGESGSGKSTLAKLLIHYYDPQKGSISIGGQKLCDMSLEALNSRISYVAQDQYLFNTSLLENIRLGRLTATDEEVIEAAKKAQCMEFIEKLPQGIHSMAGDAGKMLSGGQRQRISLARAILKDAPIVVLDEATAYADPENEEKMEAAIAELVKGKTLVVIAHKLPAIMNADQICVIDHGKLVAAGKHQDLIRSCPEYQKLWKAAQDSAEWKVHTAKEGA